MIDYSPIINQIVFRGKNPMTGMEVDVIFNEQNQPHKRLLMWNPLMGKWMHSRDAGLTWKAWYGICEDIIKDTDLVLKWRGE